MAILRHVFEDIGAASFAVWWTMGLGTQVLMLWPGS